MSDQDHEIRLMRQLVDEIRDEQPPDVDWDRVESKLMRQVEPAPVSARPQVGEQNAIAVQQTTVTLFDGDFVLEHRSIPCRG